MRLNAANILTMVRFLIAPFFVAAVLGNTLFSGAAALLLFMAASFTDYLDGKLARRHGLQTPFGEFMDPLADKVLVASAFISLALHPEILVPLWLVGVILLRELFVTYMRVLGIRKKKRLKTEMVGKAKTAVQMLSIVLILLVLLIRLAIISSRPQAASLSGLAFWRDAAGPLGQPVYYLPLCLTAVSAIFALLSLVLYVCRNLHLFSELSKRIRS